MREAERFWAKVERRGPDDCWPFFGATNGFGYGTFSYNGRMRVATHASLMLAGIEVPRGSIVCHKCDNPPCVNPAHLFVGTQRDNLLDMHRKGRGFSVGRGVTECPKGHAYNSENTRTYRGMRHCRQCDRDRNVDNEVRLTAARERQRRLRASRRRG